MYDGLHEALQTLAMSTQADLEARQQRQLSEYQGRMDAIQACLHRIGMALACAPAGRHAVATRTRRFAPVHLTRSLRRMPPWPTVRWPEQLQEVLEHISLSVTSVYRDVWP